MEGLVRLGLPPSAAAAYVIQGRSRFNLQQGRGTRRRDRGGGGRAGGGAAARGVR